MILTDQIYLFKRRIAEIVEGIENKTIKPKTGQKEISFLNNSIRNIELNHGKTRLETIKSKL